MPLVLLTGGEPLLQRELPSCAAALLGTRLRGDDRDRRPSRHRSLPAGVVVILDVKTPGSGESDKMCWANLERLGPRDAVKFVVTDERDYQWAREIIREKRARRALPRARLAVVRPGAPKELVAWMLRDRLPARLNLQIHKYVWPPDERGV